MKNLDAEHCVTVMKETKMTLTNGEAPMFVGNTAKGPSVPLKAIYRFNATPLKVATPFLT